MDESDVYNTDGSLSKSVSLSFSGSSVDHSQSACSMENSEDESNAMEKSTIQRKKSRNKRVELIAPEEKLKRCEKRFKTYADKGDSENAMVELLKMPPLTCLVYGKQSWKFAEACAKLSKGYLGFRGLGQQSLKHAEIAKAAILSSSHPSKAERASFIKCIAEVYLCLGKSLTAVGEKYKAAEHSLLKAWQVLKSIKSDSEVIMLPSDAEDVQIYNLKKEIKISLADVYTKKKQIDKAVLCLEYTIKLITDHSSGHDEGLIKIYNMLAKAERSRKKSEINYDTIVEYCLKAHEISSSCHALNSTEVADTAFALGCAYANIDSEQTQKTAETYFNEALNTYINCSGSDDPNVLKVQDALCKVWTRTDREDQAVKQLKQSVPVKAEAFGECSAQVANTHKLIGGVLLAQGDVVNAHKYLKKCLDVELELHGQKHWKTKSTQDTIVLVEQHPSFAKTKDASLKGRPKFLSTVKPGK